MITKAEKAAPLYQRIIDEVTARIERRELLPGQALPTRPELAREFGAARATVDKALSELLRTGLLEAGSGKRTTVAAVPRKPRLGSIAVLWDWNTDEERQGGEYLDLLFRGVREACAQHLLTVHFRRAPLHSACDVLKETGADGILVIRPEYADGPALDLVAASGVPVVAAPAILDDANFPCLATDNAGGVEAAVSHLAEMGHREIGFLDLTATIPDHFERLQAFLAATAARGLAVNPDWVFLRHERSPSLFADALGSWLERTHPTAILAGDFHMALALLRRLDARGLRVPDDVSVVSFDDPAAAESLRPPLTTVAQPVSRIGFRAVERLLEFNEGEDIPRFERLPATLVPRGSVLSRLAVPAR